MMRRGGLRGVVGIGLLWLGGIGCAQLPHGVGDEPKTKDAGAPATFEFPDAGTGMSAASDDAGDPPPDPEQPGSRPPPPISGGTLIILRDGNTAVAADPDRDRVFIADVAKKSLLAEVKLAAGDEPGRSVEGTAGMVHVVLRGAGAIATIDTGKAMVTLRRAVCAAPRGIAWDPIGNRLHVACAGGELVTLPEAAGPPSRTLHLDRDLRDVVVDGANLFVSRFRSAEVLLVDETHGVVSQRLQPPRFSSPSVRGGNGFAPAVAWRMARLPGGGGVVMVHQRGVADSVQTQQGGYGAPAAQCQSAIVHTTVSILRPGQGVAPSAVLPSMVAPVDLAISPNGATVVAAGNTVHTGPSVRTVPLSVFTQAQGCVNAGTPLQPQGQPTAVAYLPGGDLVVQTREPAGLFLAASGTSIGLSSLSRLDEGHETFHHDAGGNIACASCHPEGGDDGRVWPFDTGARRTQPLRIGILGTEPFHWNGDLPDFAHLITEVFTKRMNGPALDAKQAYVLSQWVNSIPALPSSPPVDPVAAARGKHLFNDQTVGCFVCHSGPKLTNNATVNVGTGGAFQVPSLRGVAGRAPYLHNGCAATLRDRFNSCGGGDQHGLTYQLSASQIDDLVAYLETL